MNPDVVYAGLRKHIQTFFQGHRYEETMWTLGPVEWVPGLRIACIGPGPNTEFWMYVSIGAWEMQRAAESTLEFFIIAPEENLRHVELLTMTAWYHGTDCLGLGHTFPIGGPWLEGSNCTFMLVSLPYTFGPMLERCEVDGTEIKLLWLLPITQAEREFKAAHGLEELEQLFEAKGVEYWNPRRASVV